MPRELRNAQQWLLLRGLSREKEHWGDFLKKFEKHFPNAKVSALDLPGTGEHYAVKSPASVDRVVEFVRADWAAKHPNAPAPYIFALSLGAMVTVRWMHRFPAEVAGAVLVNTSLRGVSPFYQRMSASAIATLIRIFLDPSIKARERRILQLTSQHQEWDETVLERRCEIQRKRPVSKLNAARQILAALSTIDIKNKPSQPVLLLNSLGDLLVHPECSKAIARLWGVPLRRHAWAGHDLPLDDADWTLRAVSEWVDALPQATPNQKPAKSK